MSDSPDASPSSALSASPTLSSASSASSVIAGQIVYRALTHDDLSAAHALSVAVKWPHRLEDWRFIAQVGEGFVAEENGALIGSALYWKYGTDTATLGMVIVSPEQQGRGIGRQLMQMVLDALGDRTVFLNATVAGKPLYEKLGFRAVGSIDQHQGAAFQPPLISLLPGERLRPLGASDVPRLAALATQACGMDRSVVLPALLDIADGIALDRDGELLGFALFRRFGRGFAIGPVVALADENASSGTHPSTSPNSEAGAENARAKALISHWLSLNEGVFVRVDLTGDSGLGEWLRDLGLPRVDSVVKMKRAGARGTSSEASALRQFSIINQALG